MDSTNMVLSNDSNYQPWNTKRLSCNSPIFSNRITSMKFNDAKNDNSSVDLLSYLNHQNQKEIKQKENVRIKLCKK